MTYPNDFIAYIERYRAMFLVTFIILIGYFYNTHIYFIGYFYNTFGYLYLCK